MKVSPPNFHIDEIQWGDLIKSLSDINHNLEVKFKEIDKSLVDLDNVDKNFNKRINDLEDNKAGKIGSIEIFGDVPVVGEYLIQNIFKKKILEEDIISSDDEMEKSFDLCE